MGKLTEACNLFRSRFQMFLQVIFSMKQMISQNHTFYYQQKFRNLIISFACDAYMHKILWTLCLDCLVIVVIYNKSCVYFSNWLRNGHKVLGLHTWPTSQGLKHKILGTMHHRAGVGWYTHSILQGKTPKQIINTI